MTSKAIENSSCSYYVRDWGMLVIVEKYPRGISGTSKRQRLGIRRLTLGTSKFKEDSADQARRNLLDGRLGNELRHGRNWRVDCLQCKQRKRAHLRDREVAFNKPPFAAAVRVALPREVVEPRCLLDNQQAPRPMPGGLTFETRDFFDPSVNATRLRIWLGRRHSCPSY